MMALQGKFIKVFKFLGNVNKNILGNTCRPKLNLYLQSSSVHQSVEEKYKIPPKPKRPLTPYFKFMSQVRQEIKNENQNFTSVDIIREVAKRWEKVDLHTKQKLEHEYKKEQDVYTKERLDYDMKLTEEQKNALKQERKERLEHKEKLKRRKKCRENNRPKKPASPFVLFFKTKLASRGSTDFKTFQKQVAAEWVKLSESEKQPFVDEMNKQSKEYQAKMVAWEREMIKMGNTDIIRQDAVIEPVLKPKGKKKE